MWWGEGAEADKRWEGEVREVEVLGTRYEVRDGGRVRGCERVWEGVRGFERREAVEAIGKNKSMRTSGECEGEGWSE